MLIGDRDMAPLTDGICAPPYELHVCGDGPTSGPAAGFYRFGVANVFGMYPTTIIWPV